MAAIEFINRKNKTYGALRRVINYITRSDKTEDSLIYGELCNKSTAYEDFIQVKQMYGKEMVPANSYFLVIHHKEIKSSRKHSSTPYLYVVRKKRAIFI